MEESIFQPETYHKEEFRHWANLFPEAILLVDSSGIILAANQSAIKEFPFLQPSSKRASLADLTFETDGYLADYLRICSRTTKFMPGAITLRTAEMEGGRYDAETALYRPKTSLSPALLLMRLTRKESRKHSFFVLTEKISQLSAEILRRRQAEDEAIMQRQKFEELNRHKDEFLAMLGHELRNPLAPIKSALQILALRKGAEGSDKGTLAIIDRQVTHLVRIVDELLDAARVSTGRINLKKETVEVASLISRAVELSEPLIREKHHALHVNQPSEPLYLQGDLPRLTQILGNILNNAAKYTEPYGRIEINVFNVGDTVEIAVKDNGIGISKEILPQVFDLFTQSEKALDRAQGGLGIGLTVVKHLVEKHGGTIVASSEGLGKGSEFRVMFPLVEPPQADLPSSTPLQEESVGRRILVVDDNPDARELLAEFLTIIGNDVITASDGNSALSAALEALPAIIILDLGLPGMDGYEVAKKLRTVDGLEDTLLIALTGYGQPGDRRRTREAGFDHHLVKPVDLNDIKALIDSFDNNRARAILHHDIPLSGAA
jgi:signal transduction histidine kinase/CheY-like chemotaxis protein